MFRLRPSHSENKVILLILLYSLCKIVSFNQRKLNYDTGKENLCKVSIPLPSCSVPHTRSLEARIKEELVSQGLLDSEERQGTGGDSEDEVLAELQKRQAELKALSAHNRARKQELLR